MTHLNNAIRRRFAGVATRRIPQSWIDAQPALAEYPTPAALVAAIRDDESQPALSDTLVRAMLRLAPDHQDAALALLEALATKATSRVGPSSPEFREDVLVDLACVIVDCEDLHELDRLVYRIAGRAYRRSRRRLHMETRWIDSAVELEWGIEYIEPVCSAEDAVVPRMQFEHVCQLLNDALDSGALARFAWEDFRDGRLAPLLGYPRTDINKDRLYKRGREVRRHLLHAS